ncbi:peptidylprolyl isomerase [Streptomyces sp. NPDC051018]|uniref:peptidylprolyl isomerase n=1 Tax=Streptomyces sp. NPDC051018 TaxID=3365639 RepID=UPI0037B4D5F8
MVSSDQRRRQLAREKFERQQKRRAQARRRKQRNTVIAAAVAVVLAAGAAAYASIGLSDNGDTGDRASDEPAAQPSTPAPAESKVPEPALSIDRKAAYTMTLTTGQGAVGIAMEASKTPRTVNSFKALADKGYFDDMKCHRLSTQEPYVLQCGDPKGDGTGGPGYNIPDENLKALGKAGADGKVPYPAGTVAMANTGQPDSGGSQFFMVYKDTRLPPSYTVFGKMDAAGLKTVQDVAKAGVEGGAEDGAPATAVTIRKATVTKG